MHDLVSERFKYQGLVDHIDGVVQRLRSEIAVVSCRSLSYANLRYQLTEETRFLDYYKAHLEETQSRIDTTRARLSILYSIKKSLKTR